MIERDEDLARLPMEELRQRMLDADRRGDVAELERLRAEYRRREVER